MINTIDEIKFFRKEGKNDAYRFGNRPTSNDLAN